MYVREYVGIEHQHHLGLEKFEYVQRTCQKKRVNLLYFCKWGLQKKGMRVSK